MNIEDRIQKRFRELSYKIENIFCDGEVDTTNFTGWGMSVLNLLQRVYGVNSIQYERFIEEFEEAINGTNWSADVCVGVFQSAYEDYENGYLFYENGYLFNVRSLVKAELGDDVLEQSKALLKGNYKDIACVVAGISLEFALKDLCSRNSIEYDKKTKLEQLNIELRKAEIYNEAMRKQITAWIARRNHAAHGQWDEYNHADVKDLINGVERFIGEYLS